MRTNWSVEKWITNAWVADGTIYKSNQNLGVDIVATQSKVQMTDGSYAFFTPETVYNKEPLTFQWLEIAPSDAFVTKISNYVKNGNYLRLTDSLGETYTGKFIALRRVWLLGIEDTWDLEGTFEVFVN